MIHNHLPLRADQTFLLANCIKDAGYRTGYIGNRHREDGHRPAFVPKDRRFGWEHFASLTLGHDTMSSIYFDYIGQPYHSKRYESDYQTDQLMAFIDDDANAPNAKPWIGYVSYGAPHFSIQAPENLRHMYPDEAPLPPGAPNPALPVNVQKIRSEAYCHGDPSNPHNSQKTYNQKSDGEPETGAEIHQLIAEYYGMLHSIDWNLGHILCQSEALGPTDDTMIIFMSDHGEMPEQPGSCDGIKCEGYRVPCTCH